MNNPSGINPIEYNVLLKGEDVDEKTAGGLIKPENLMEQEKHGSTRGTIVALSPYAFNEDIFPKEMQKPKPGQKVTIARHAGAFVKGEDGEEYRMVKDKDVTALIGTAND